MARVVVADSMRLTPPVTAAEAWPEQMAEWPRWADTREDEQAVSVEMQGPCRLSV